MTDEPRSTPLVERHEALGARMVDFAGWRMPIQYTGIIDEHRAVRERAGLFDLCHMGELFVDGPDAGDALAARRHHRPAHPRRRPRPLLDDLRPRRRDPRRPDRLPAGRGPLPRRRQRLQRGRRLRRPRGAARGPPRRPRRPLAGDGAGGRSRARPRRASWRRWPTSTSRRSTTTGSRRGRWPACRPSSPGPATPARTASRSSSTAVAGTTIWDALARRRARRGPRPGRPRRARHAAPGGRHAALRQRARPRHDAVRGGPRAGRQARQGGRLRRARGAREGRRGGPAPKPRRARGARPGHRPPRPSGLVRASAGAASSRRGTMSPTLGVPIAMAYVAPADAAPGTMLDVEIRDARAAAEVVPLPFYTRRR